MSFKNHLIGAEQPANPALPLHPVLISLPHLLTHAALSC